MASANVISNTALNFLADALLATAARIEREQQAQRDADRLSAIFGAPVAANEIDLNFTIASTNTPVGAGK